MLRRTPALAGQGPRPLLQVSPVGPQLRPSWLRSHLRLTAASRLAKQSLSASLCWSLRQGGSRPPRPAPPRPVPAPASPHSSQESTHGDPGPRAAAAEGDERPGTPRGGGAAGQGAGTEAGGRGRTPHASACRLRHAGPLCACSSGATEDTCRLPTNRSAS